MEAVRAGLTLQLKEAVGCEIIAEREETLMRRVRGWMATDRGAIQYVSESLKI